MAADSAKPEVVAFAPLPIAIPRTRRSLFSLLTQNPSARPAEEAVVRPVVVAEGGLAEELAALVGPEGRAALVAVAEPVVPEEQVEQAVAAAPVGRVVELVAE